MGLFRRSTQQLANINDPGLSDGSWLSSAESRYERLVSGHYGSPDTIADGGDRCVSQGDIGAALFFFQKAIDTLHSIYVCGPGGIGPSDWVRQPSLRDHDIVDRYLEVLRQILSLRPNATIGPSVVEVTHRLRTISSAFERYGINAQPYLSRLDELARIAPAVDVSDVFW